MNSQPSPTSTTAAPIAAGVTPEPVIAGTASAEPTARVEVDNNAAFDAPRTFLGPRADYYDESWRWMDWTGRRWSWNPAAALGFAGWLAYRRMYGPTALALLWLVLAAAFVAQGGSLVLAAALHAGFALALGFYGNALYLRHFRRRARTVREEDHDRCLAALAKLGGTSRGAVLAVAAAAAILIAATVHLVGGGELTLRWG